MQIPPSNRSRWGAISSGLAVALIVMVGCSSGDSGSDEADEQTREESTLTSASTPESTESTDDGTEAPETTDTTVAPAFATVIVTLDVAWRPVSELSEAEVATQNGEIAAAKDTVLADLGEHGFLARPEDRLDALGIASLIVSVDPTGRQLLVDHPMVTSVEEPADIELR